ncbi:MAG: glycosyl hydrolase, partial [Paludibacter sp.]|nr:glycosyl hydrolase [Paludibacter sp.]
MQNKIINSLFKSFKVNLIWLINCLVVFTVFSCQPKELSLEENFKNPPASVNPWCYWYWYSDNISKEGIDKDLKAMSEVGITTVLIGNVTQGGVQGTVEALTDEWWDMVKYAIKQAGEYGIDVGFFNCPGWSQSGGPWISDEQSMRHIITNEVYAKGNTRFDEEMWAPEGFYQDVRVLAFPTPKNDKVVLINALASVTTSIKGVNPSHLIDGDPSTVFTIPEEALSANRFEVEIEAKEAFEARSLILQPAPQQFIMDIQLYAQLEGEDYTLIREFNFQRPPKGDLQIGPMFDAPKVISFPVLTARKFKLVFSNFSYHAFYGRNNQNPGFGEIAISGAYRLDHFIEKKLSKVFPMPLPMWHDYMWEKSNDADVQELLIDETQLIDLTDKIDDNRLVWDVPEGDWTIVRVMMVSTGAKNSPVLPAAQGPEVDKLTKELAYHHFDSYIGRLIREMPEEDRKALKYCVIDSYEQGSQNWTDNLEKPFRERYGYDPIPYLAAFTGRVVGSVEKTERFFWDLRRMIADRVAHEYAAGMRERSNQNGLKLWMENYGHWGFPGESLQYGGQGDILAGEFWAQGDLGSIEIKAAASASNLYDKGIVCCESFTSGPPNFFLHPWSIKRRGDWSMTEGVNQVVLHVYLHQPDDVRIPGVNAPFGTEFNRHNTWFYTMGGFIDYTKRNSYMLQQGKFVADVLYFTGEDAPKMTGIQDPALPKGYAFDYINSEVIMERLDVKKGKFVLPNGIKYSVLVLPGLDNMRPELLAKIKT